MSGYIRRTHGYDTVTVASGAAISSEINISEIAAGALYVPSGWTGGATIAFSAAEKSGGTFATLRDSSDAAVSLTVTAARWYALPAEVMVCRYIKLTCSATSRDESLLLTTKS